MITKRVFAGAVFALVAVFALRAGVVSAHHSRSHYESDDKQRILKGTVAEYKWRNPHVFVVWEVKDESGKVVQWTGELSSVTTSIADGLNKNSLKPGEEISVLAIPSRSGTPEALVRKITKADGKIIVDLTRENIRTSDR